MSALSDLLPGTLDLLVLKAVSLGPLHGYGILLRIQQISQRMLQIEQGSLYPALYRLEQAGLIASERGGSDNNRPPSVYRLTGAGPSPLRKEAGQWRLLSSPIRNGMGALQRDP